MVQRPLETSNVV